MPRADEQPRVRLAGAAVRRDELELLHPRRPRLPDLDDDTFDAARCHGRVGSPARTTASPTSRRPPVSKSAARRRRAHSASRRYRRPRGARMGADAGRARALFHDFTVDAVPPPTATRARRFAALGCVASGLSTVPRSTTRSADTRHGDALAYLIGDVDRRHGLSIATGYVNLGGPASSGVGRRRTPDPPAARGRTRCPGWAQLPPIDRFASHLERLREERDLSRFPPSARPSSLPRSSNGSTARRSRSAATCAVPARQGIPVRRRHRCPRRARHLGESHRRRA